VLASALFTWLGLPLARRLAPAGIPPLALAPALGWATASVLALPVLSLTGFSQGAAWAFTLVLIGLAAWRRRRPGPALPAGAMLAALALGIVPLMAIMPKATAAGLLLAPPLFDHVKIAIVDAILRAGLPVPNPFYGPANPGHLAYYYLWHFSAAWLARLQGIGGWQAEAGMTGFTAYASILLMLGLCRALGGAMWAMILVPLLSLSGSARPLLEAVLGHEGANAAIPRGSEIGNWLNQAAWVPQHLASACCVVLSALLMLRLSESGGILAALCLGLTVAAGFESSAWVGGIAFAVAGCALGLWLLWRMPRETCLAFVGRGAGAAILAAALIAPFILAELHATAAREAGAAIALLPTQVFGAALPPAWRAVLNPPAFWLVLLPFAFPALVPMAATAVRAVPRQPEPATTLAATLAILAFACLCVSWMLRSTIDNNDLGWRAVLPALLVLPAFAARLDLRRSWIVCAVCALLGIPQAASMLRDYAIGQRPGAPAAFTQTENLWPELRRIAAPEDRVANNPLLAAAATPWPDNIAWALFADRPSCYAGWETVLAYGAVSRARLEDINARFTRVFAGVPSADDIEQLAMSDHCAVVAILPGDGAWGKDPFAGSPYFVLADSNRNWRIYRRRK